MSIIPSDRKMCITVLFTELADFFASLCGQAGTGARAGGGELKVC